MSSAGAADRSRGVGISIGNYAYVGTGWDGSQNWSGWWRYDPSNDTWAQMSDFTSAPVTPGTARRECVAFSVGGMGYLGLGYDGSATFQGMWKYDPGNNSWTYSGATGIPRYSAASFVIGNKAYVSTGYDSGTNTYFNDLWEFTPPTAWVQKANFPGGARLGSVGFSIGAFGYVGTGDDGAAYKSDFWRYNPQTNSWTQKASLPGPRAFSAAFSLNGKGYVVGGFDGSPIDETLEYNPISNQWVARASFGAGNRYRAVGFSLNGKGYVGTGTSTGFDVLGDLWQYNPANIPPITFQKTYGGTNDDTDTTGISQNNSRIAFGCTTADGGYILASSTKSFGAGGYDIYLVKTDPVGNVQWSKTLGTSSAFEIASSVRQTADGGYIISGNTGIANTDGLIIKTSSNGTIQWNKNFGNTIGLFESANYAEELPGGGYIVTGLINSTQNRACVIKLLSNGNPSFGQSYNPGASNISEGFSVEPVLGGNYVVSGTIKTGSSSDVYLTVLNSSGTFVSSTPTNIGISGNNDFRGIARATPDGGYILCASTGLTVLSSDIFLIKTSSSGVVTWAKKYGTAQDDVARAIVVTNTGDYAIAGYTKSFGAGAEDAFLLKTDASGTFKWMTTYGGTASDRANSIFQTADAGYVIVGETSSFGSGGTDIYVIKTDSLGNSGCNEASQSLLPTTVSTATATTTGNAAIVSSFGTLPNPIVITPSTTNLCLNCTFPIGISTSDVQCFGDCSGNAFVGASGGAMPYTYVWSHGVTTSSASLGGLCAGNYTVTVFDAGGCDATDSITITQPVQPLSISVFDDTVDICTGGFDTLFTTASGGMGTYSYSWSPSAGLSSTSSPSPKANPTVTTTYVVTVLDGNGCVSSDTVVVMLHSLPNVIASGGNTICSGASTNLIATGASVYSWSPAAGLSNPNIFNPVATPTITITYLVVGTNAFGCSDSANVTVTVVSSPTVNITPGSTTFCSGGGDTLVANSSGTSYSWSTGATTSSIPAFPSSTTTYSVTVSNGTCTSTDSAVITINPRPFPVMTTGNVSCNGACDGASTATPSAGTAPFSYVWSPTAQTTSSATGLCPGVYTAIVTDANGCSANGKDTITQPPVLSAAVAPNNAGCVCNGSASVVASGGTAPYSYSWSSGGSSSAVSNLCGGNYSVTVTDNNGCNAVKSFNINQLPPVVVSVSPNITICSGNTTTIGANVSGAANITYFWMPGNFTTDTISVAPTSNTTYTVIASDSVSNCSDTNTVSVNVIITPTVSITGNSFLCLGDSATLTASGGSFYSWSTGSTASFIIVSPTSTTSYSVSASSAPAGQCFGTDTVSVSVGTAPAVTATASSYTLCTGISSDTLIAAASGGTNYSWVPPPPFPQSPNNDTVIVSPDFVGANTYTVYVSNAGGCTGSSTVTINVSQGFGKPIINPVPDYCLGDSVLPVTGINSPPAIIVWINSSGNIAGYGNTLPIPQGLAAGTYSVYAIQGTDEYCLSDPELATLTIHPLPNVSAGPDITICPGHTANLQAAGGINYLWSPADYLNDASVYNPSSNPDSAITYQVLVTDSKGCKNKDTITVFVVTNDTCGIVIYNVLTPNGDGDNDVFFIDGINLFPENFVEIFNRWGNSVWRGKNYDNRKVVWRGQNEAGQPLPAGTYYYVIDVKGLGRFTGWVELLR